MNYKIFKKCIDAYLDEELNEEESSAFEQHLKSCSLCRRELMSFDKCIQLMNVFMKEIKPPNKIRQGVFDKMDCDDIMRMCLPSL